jgi:dihydrodipicolinate synthase/N-acetylneuraminate lyase
MIRGVYPVIQMPLDADENIDQKVLANEIEWLISKKCAGIVLAMVSEVMRFSFLERRTMWQLVLQNLQG